MHSLKPPRVRLRTDAEMSDARKSHSGAFTVNSTVIQAKFERSVKRWNDSRSQFAAAKGAFPFDHKPLSALGTAIPKADLADVSSAALDAELFQAVPKIRGGRNE